MKQVDVISQGKGVQSDKYFGDKGVKYDKVSADEKYGRPAGSHSPVAAEYKTCQPVKKTGEACTAAAVKSQALCIGHLRQAEKATA
jgi:hypothetical protein